MNVLALAASLALAQAPAPEAPPVAEPAAVPEPASEPAPARPSVPKPARPRPTAPATAAPASPARAVTPTGESAFGPAEVEPVARAFLDALARRDAEALAAAAGDRFSFDGDVQSGREAIRRRWRTILFDRAPAPAPRVGEVQVVPVAEAVAKHGRPPPRLAALARPGVLVAIADVGGRTVVLFVAREAGRIAVLGMQG